MTPDEKQYDLLARCLDGERVRLDESQKALAEELRRDEQAIFSRLDVKVPAGVMQRVSAQLTQAMEQQALRVRPRPHPTFARVLRWSGAMAAAAAVVLAVWAGMTILKPKPAPPKNQPAAIAKLLVNPVDAATIDPFEPRADLLAREMSSLAAEVMTPPASNGVDAGIVVAEQAVQDFYNDGPALLPMSAGAEVSQ